MKTGRTQKEIKPLIKAEVDAFMVELIKKYPEIPNSSLVDFIGDETRRATYEYLFHGHPLSNKERWEWTH